MFPVSLHGPRLTLREFRDTDAAAIFSYASNPAVAQHVPWRTHADLTDSVDFLQDVLAKAYASPRVTYALAVTIADQLIGTGRINIVNAQYRRGDVGYVLHPDWWSKGFGTETAGLLRDFGFDRLGLRRIEATAHPDNIGSQRVLEKIGLQYE
jgi:RimJ/RimL family protein N-acetyltransferase